MPELGEVWGLVEEVVEESELEEGEKQTKREEEAGHDKQGGTQIHIMTPLLGGIVGSSQDIPS